MTEEFTLYNDIRPTNKPPRLNTIKALSEQVALMKRIENSYTLEEIAEIDGTSIENVKLFLEEDHDLPFFKVDGKYYFDKHIHDAWVKQKTKEVFDLMTRIQKESTFYKRLPKSITLDKNLGVTLRFLHKINKVHVEDTNE